MEVNRGRAFLDELFRQTGWEHDWDKLGDESGYSVRTLKGVYSGELQFSAKMERELTKLLRRLAEDPATYNVTLHEPGKPSRKVLIPAESEAEMVAHLIEMLRDFTTASLPTRRILMREIEDVIGALRKNVFPGQSQSQGQNP